MSSINNLIASYRLTSGFLLGLLLFPPRVFAAGSGLPWETPLQNLSASFTGPVPTAIGAVAIVMTGLGLALGEGGGIARRALGVVFGLSIAFAAVSFFLAFFGDGGGLAI